MNETTPQNPVISHEEISPRARVLWQNAGNPEGRDLEFWLGAEDELHRERMRKTPPSSLNPSASKSPSKTTTKNAVR